MALPISASRPLSKEKAAAVLRPQSKRQVVCHFSNNDNGRGDGSSSNDDDCNNGDGDGSGKNILGIILMETRNSLPEYTGNFYLPQWLAYPDVHPYDIFWRMGIGEDYVMKYGKWLYSISKEAQREYRRYFKPPKGWEDWEDEEDEGHGNKY